MGHCLGDFEYNWIFRVTLKNLDLLFSSIVTVYTKFFPIFSRSGGTWYSLFEPSFLNLV